MTKFSTSDSWVRLSSFLDFFGKKTRSFHIKILLPSETESTQCVESWWSSPFLLHPSTPCTLVQLLPLTLSRIIHFFFSLPIASLCSSFSDYMVEKLGIDDSKISDMCNLLYKNYGTTMAGLRVGFMIFYVFKIRTRKQLCPPWVKLTQPSHMRLSRVGPSLPWA